MEDWSWEAEKRKETTVDIACNIDSLMGYISNYKLDKNLNKSN
jgi:hypothetical protein